MREQRVTHPETVPAALRAAGAAYGDRVAVVDGATTLTFRELNAAVRDAARGYRALGLETGDRVCLWAPNTWQWVVAGLAVTYAGGVLVPVNTRYRGAEVADVVERSGARLCVVADGFLGRSQVEELRTALPGLPGVLAVVALGETAPSGTTPYDDLAELGAGVADIDITATDVGRRRPRRHPVHLRDHRPLQGRAHHPPPDGRRRPGVDPDLSGHRAGPLPGDQPVLPLLRLQGRASSRASSPAARSTRWPPSTPRPRWP